MSWILIFRSKRCGKNDFWCKMAGISKATPKASPFFQYEICFVVQSNNVPMTSFSPKVCPYTWYWLLKDFLPVPPYPKLKRSSPTRSELWPHDQPILHKCLFRSSSSSLWLFLSSKFSSILTSKYHCPEKLN